MTVSRTLAVIVVRSPDGSKWPVHVRSPRWGNETLRWNFPSAQRREASGLRRSHPRLFDHLVGAIEDGQRDGEVERLRRLHVDDEVVLCGLLDGEVSGLSSLEYLA